MVCATARQQRTPRAAAPRLRAEVLRSCALAPALLVLLVPGCAWLQPSNDRQWEPDQAVLPRAVIRGDQVDVYNVRDFKYVTTDVYAIDYYDKSYDLNKLDSVDFIVVPFKETPLLAHTMLSFGFSGRDYLAVSVEIRKEKGEEYRPAQGALNQYELMYVLGDERDLVKLRTNHRQDEVYLYPVRTTPCQARALFVDVMQRVNKLYAEPEFYHTLTNNCTTNIVQHINNVAPGRVPPYDYRVLLPGLSDQMAYDLGLIDTTKSFAETRFAAGISGRARRHANSPDFSQRIRR